MPSTSSHRYDEPGNSGGTDMSNTNENRNHPNQGQSSSTSSQTLYIPIASPPTPAPSPGPVIHLSQGNPFPPLTMMNIQNSQKHRHFLTSVVSSCTPSELLFVSQTINHRDFLYSLPTKLSLYILKFIDEPKTLVRADQVSKHWRSIVRVYEMKVCGRGCVSYMDSMIGIWKKRCCHNATRSD
jgi:F-box-like